LDDSRLPVVGRKEVPDDLRRVEGAARPTEEEARQRLAVAGPGVTPVVDPVEDDVGGG